MLEARQIPSYPKRLYSEVEGDIEKIDGTIVITRIRVKYHLKVPRGTRETVERALKIHESKCPAAESVKRRIEVSWMADIEEE